MSCDDLQELIHGYVDGELDLVRSLEMERHLQECPACAAVHERLRAVRSAMSSSYFQPPPGLENRIRFQLRAAAKAERSARRFPIAWQWAAAAALVVLAVALTWQFAIMRQRNGATALLAQQVLAGHVRSLMASHLTDVASTDQHTVKPWFAGKLDFSPAVADFSDRGFALVGGRLDYLENRPVAALVYQRRKHVINVFIWPAPDRADSPIEATSYQGYQLLHWTRSHMNHWAVSDLNAQELTQLADWLRKAG
jgi:anti-sigma factor RsiW